MKIPVQKELCCKPSSYTPEDWKRIELAAGLVPKNAAVLDIGCYDGIISRYISETRQCDVAGIDCSNNAVSMASENGIRAVRGNAERALPFNDRTFDAIFASEVIEHIYNTDTFLKECWRVLRPGGDMIITTPNLAGFGSRIALMFGRKPWMVENRSSSASPGHIRYFNFGELASILRENKFEVIVMTTQGVKLSHNIFISLPFAKGLGLHIICKARKAIR